MFAVIMPLPRAGSPGREPHSWHELATTDPIAALTFYHQLFGWEEAGASDMGPDLGTYQIRLRWRADGRHDEAAGAGPWPGGVARLRPGR